MSIVQLFEKYNMTFESEPPLDMRLQFQRTSPLGNIDNYIIVKIHYPKPNSIRIENKGRIIKPTTLQTDSNNET